MLYTLYLTKKEEEFKVYYSPCMAYDFSYWTERGLVVHFLAGPLPLGLVHALRQEVHELLEGAGAKSILKMFWRKKLTVSKARSVCKKVLAQLGVKTGADGLEPLPYEFVEPCPADLEGVRSKVQGKALLWPELIKSLKEAGRYETDALEYAVQRLYLEGSVEILPGVGYESPGRLKCYRCGSSAKIIGVDCPRCNAKCFYCEECILLGTARFCEPLIIGQSLDNPGGHLLETTSVKPVYSFKGLTPAQEEASRELVEFISDPGAEVGLMWAVCGAGKTEVVFAAIARVLVNGGNVLYASPRRDVVAELYPRFKESFPGVPVVALYGGSPDKFSEGAITLATTHQAIRFVNRFDLVVLDEADAFPYRNSSFLPRVLERTRVQGSKVIYMTATPDTKIWSEIVDKNGKVITLSARHHGHRLPVPQVLKTPVIREELLAAQLAQWLFQRGIQAKAPVFIFVPTVSKGLEVVSVIREALGSNHLVEFVHAGDTERDNKRKEFAAGKFPFLVTTTILERGITVAGAHVVVLWADSERIFTKEALIQTAGRAGRAARCPEGDVLFVAPTINLAIENAIGEIKRLNLMAESKGLIL